MNLNYTPIPPNTRLMPHNSPSPRETVLGELPGGCDEQRVLVVHVVDFAAPPQTRIELRQQSYGPGVGWFTQSSVQLTPDQLGGLRSILGQAPAQSAPPRQLTTSGLRLLRADSA